MTDACIAEASFDLAPDVGMEDAPPKMPSLAPHYGQSRAKQRPAPEG
jgi:hypothetical protein